MTLGWRINAFCCAFCCGWILYAALFQRSDNLICFELSRFGAGCAGILALTFIACLRQLDWRKIFRSTEKDERTEPDATDGVSEKETAAESETVAIEVQTKCAEKAEGTEGRAEGKAVEEQPKSAAMSADEAWNRARSMMHNIVPDYGADGKYLTLVRYAANLGHGEALIKLGEYAQRRGCIVEAAYWEAMALIRGCDDGGMRIRKYTQYWVAEGCPDEIELIHPWFSPDQSSFGRSVLRYYSGVDVPLALMRFSEMAKAGNSDAANLLRYFNVEMGAFRK